MDVQFINSTVGRKFLEYTVPELVRQITKLNKHLEKLVALEEEPLVNAISTKSVGDINREIKTDLERIN